MSISKTQARQAKEAAKTELADLPCVAGIGICKVGDDYAVKVNLTATLPADITPPDRIEGVPIVFEVVGEIRKR
jgi:hypothetical protein